MEGFWSGCFAEKPPMIGYYSYVDNATVQKPWPVMQDKIGDDVVTVFGWHGYCQESDTTIKVKLRYSLNDGPEQETEGIATRLEGNHIRMDFDSVLGGLCIEW